MTEGEQQGEGAMPLQATEAGAGDVDPVLSVDGVTRIFSNGQGVAEVSFAVARARWSASVA
ncbi:MAG: hypothetical protein ACLFMS_01295 [Halorhodospira sp.]